MTGKIEDATGLIENNAGLINQDTWMINDSTWLIPKTKTEYTASGRRKRSRERDKDRKPWNFPLPAIKNLPHFRNKPHKEVRQCILEKKGVDFGSIMIPILIVSAIAAGWYGLYWLIKQLEKRRETKNN